MKDFSNSTETVAGYEVINLVWNSASKTYLGFVHDPLWETKTRKYTSAQWTKSGKCINRMRSALDLKYKEND